MKSTFNTRRIVQFGAALAMSSAFATAALAAGPAMVAGPGAEPQCFKPTTADTRYFQWPAKKGPYRIALANGFIANDWRVQMIKVAKAYANQPDVKKDLKEFKVVSVGQDVAAQIAAVNNFIDQGYDAIIVDANSSSAFGSVVKKANDAGVVLLSFDNIIDDPNNIEVNVDQRGLGVTAGTFLLKETKANPANFLFVRGPAGQPVDLARADGFADAIAKSGRKVNVTEVIGNWAVGDSQKATADAIAAGGSSTQSTSKAVRRARRRPCSMQASSSSRCRARTRTRSACCATPTSTRACTASPAVPVLPSRR
jgi:ribose transport system substrate-binding protein